jgi:hypothetical protein
MDQDPMTRLRANDPIRGARLDAVDPGALSALREGITMIRREGADESAVPRARGWRRFGVRGMVGAGLALVLVGGTAAFAVHEMLHTYTDGYECMQVWDPQGVPALSVELTGDPVADCQTTLAAQGLAPLEDPVAFTYDGQVIVTPRLQVPAGATLLVPDPDAAAVRELTASSGDWVDGGRAVCRTAQEAAAWESAELVRLGLDGWTVTVDELPADTPDTQRQEFPCAGAWVDPAARTVEVLAFRAEDVTTGSGDTAAMAAALRAGITDTCVDLTQARALVDEAVGGGHHWPTTSVVDDTATCARVDMEVGGSILVTVYGPQGLTTTP